MTQEPKFSVIENINKLGRPRDSSRDLAIIESTLKHLTLYGYEALSTTDIAKEAGVSKATIYRRWPSKRFLVIDAFKTLPTLEIPNNGNLRDDLKDLLNQLSFVFTQTDVLPVLHILTGEMSHDELLEEELLPWLQERYSPARTIIERAIKRGELQENLDLESAQSIVVGPLLTMVSYSRTTINEKVLDNLFNFIVKALVNNPKDSEQEI